MPDIHVGQVYQSTAFKYIWSLSNEI